MELELKKTSLNTYEVNGEILLSQEETAETIVPDYCPDIARIIATEGKLHIHSRELREGKANISGNVRVTVLYTPDEEGGIRTLEFAIPFHAEGEARALSGSQYLLANAETELLETRMLNPRKIFTHCKLLVRVTGYQKKPLCFSADIQEGGEKLAVEKRMELQCAILLTNITEKDYTFTEEINLSPGREGAVELLSSQVSGTVTETKLVGNKLIFKGLFLACLLYRSRNGRCASVTAELPFSQIMEVEGAAEGAVPSVQLQVTGTDFQINGDDPEGRQIAVTFYFRATALLREERELTLLNDLYSTAYEVAYEAMPLSLVSFYDTLSRRQTLREVLEIGVVADSILAIHASCGSVSVSQEKANVTLRTSVNVRVMYLDEGGVPLVAERSIDASCVMEVPEHCTVTAEAVCGEEVQGSIGDRGIEVRFPVDFQVEATSKTKKISISSAKLDLEKPKDLAGTPSLVLRCLGKQEGIWDLAKQYNTTIAAILAANQLETEEEISREKLLLIPRKRA